MSTSNVIDLKDEGPFTLTIVNPDVAAKADINFSTYFPKLNMEKAEPIIMMRLKDTTDGGATSEIEYTPNDRLALADVASLSSGEYVITDEDTVNLGDATNTVGHTYRLEITAHWNRIQNN